MVPVGTGCEQLIAQQSLASDILKASSWASAALQQSIMADSDMPECMGTPAIALPLSVAVRTIDMNHFIIAKKTILGYSEPVKTDRDNERNYAPAVSDPKWSLSGQKTALKTRRLYLKNGKLI